MSGSPQPLPEGLTTLPPGPELAAAVATVDLSRLAPADVFEVLAAQQRLVAHHQARMLASLWEAGRLTYGAGVGPLDRKDGLDRFSADEAAFTLHWSLTTTQAYQHLAASGRTPHQPAPHRVRRADRRPDRPAQGVGVQLRAAAGRRRHHCHHRRADPAEGTHLDPGQPAATTGVLGPQARPRRRRPPPPGFRGRPARLRPPHRRGHRRTGWHQPAPGPGRRRLRPRRRVRPRRQGRRRPPHPQPTARRHLPRPALRRRVPDQAEPRPDHAHRRPGQQRRSRAGRGNWARYGLRWGAGASLADADWLSDVGFTDPTGRPFTTTPWSWPHLGHPLPVSLAPDVDPAWAAAFTGASLCACGGLRQTVRGGVHIQTKLSTLMCLDDDPALIPGWGPVIADIARQVASEQETRPPWFWDVTDERGNLLHHGHTRRRPTPTERALVQARDRTCRAPGCAKPALSCQQDHRRPHAHGGPTHRGNLCSLCAHHHALRHEHGYVYHQIQLGTYLMESASGRHWLVTPDADLILTAEDIEPGPPPGYVASIFGHTNEDFYADSIPAP